MEIVLTDPKMHYPQPIINIVKTVLFYMSTWYVIGLGDILLTFLQHCIYSSIYGISSCLISSCTHFEQCFHSLNDTW